jgi:RNA polymerase sigma factor (TIGR02999 family)
VSKGFVEIKDETEYPYPMPEQSTEVTALLAEWSDGNSEALDRLAPLVFDELRGLARAHMRGERLGHTLQPTALVNEVFMRLLQRHKLSWRNRRQFFQSAIQLMRRILVDHARRKKSAKRGADAIRVTLEGLSLPQTTTNSEVLELHEALEALGQKDALARRIVELKYYFGMTHQEIAEVVNLAPSTVKKKWALARLRLHRRLKKMRQA